MEAEFLNSGYLPPGVRDQVSAPIFNHLMIEILIWWHALNAFAVFLFQVIRKGVAVDFPAVNGGIPICKDFLKVPKSRAPKFTCEV